MIKYILEAEILSSGAILYVLVCARVHGLLVIFGFKR